MNSTPRVQYLKIGRTILAMDSIASDSKQRPAMRNDTMRASLKHSDHPGPDGNDCGGCLHFVPGETAIAFGTCKMMPGDTEIHIFGCCSAWAAMQP